MRSCQEKWCHSTSPGGAKTVHSASPSGMAEPHKLGTRTARPFPRRLGRGARWAEVCGALTSKRFVQVDSTLRAPQAAGHGPQRSLTGYWATDAMSLQTMRKAMTKKTMIATSERADRRRFCCSWDTKMDRRPLGISR